MSKLKCSTTIIEPGSSLNKFIKDDEYASLIYYSQCPFCDCTFLGESDVKILVAYKPKIESGFGDAVTHTYRTYKCKCGECGSIFEKEFIEKSTNWFKMFLVISAIMFVISFVFFIAFVVLGYKKVSFIFLLLHFISSPFTVMLFIDN